MGWNGLIKRCKSETQRVYPYKNLSLNLRDFQQSRLLEYDTPAANQFVQLRQGGIRIGTMDLRIASIALANQMTVVTRNRVDFERVPELNVEDWTVV